MKPDQSYLRSRTQLLNGVTFSLFVVSPFVVLGFAHPYFFIFGAWAVLLFVLAAHTKNGILQSMFIIAGSVCCFSFFGEILFWRVSQNHNIVLPIDQKQLLSKVTQSESTTVSVGSFFDYKTFYRDDKTLGFKANANIAATAKKMRGAVLLYDITYSMDEYGHRKIFYPHLESAQSSILFYGGSRTIGEGVSDQENYPALVQKELPEYKVSNFGLQGYGPHQMLRSLQNNLEKEVTKGAIPKYAFFDYSRAYKEWVFGQNSWDLAGPKYIIGKDKKLVYAGHFSNIYWIKFERRLRKSYFLDWVMIRFRNLETPISPSKAQKEDLLFAILREARDLFETRYPGSHFVVLAEPGELAEDIELLKKSNLSVLTFEKQFADFEANKEKYYIPFDGHFNAFANGLIASRIVEFIKSESALATRSQ